MNNSNLCLGCMMPKGEQQECPNCGYVEGTPQVLPCLAPGTILANRYLIGRHLRISGEGVTYIAFDRKNGRRVDIREYLPQTISTRRTGSDTVIVRDRAKAVYEDYLADFADITRAVSRLNNTPAILPVINYFEDNNTAYAVYEHLEGKPLTELIRRAKRLTWDEAAPLFSPLLSALSEAHNSGLVHFGISPESIVMSHSGRLVLTDFGVPDSRIAETELQGEMYDGFAALEQYSLDARKGKWTDVYSICAVLLYALTGKRPPDALTRARDSRLNVSSDLAEAIPAHVISAIANGLQVDSETRTQSIAELRAELYPGRRPAAAPQPRREEAPRASVSNHAGSSSGVAAFGSKVAGSVRDFGGRIGGYLSDRRNQQNSAANDSGSDDNTPWYMNLSQWQYALLSTCLTIVVLGIIAVSVFLSVRSEISGAKEDERTLEIIHVSDTDIIINTSEKALVPQLVGKEWTPELVNEYMHFSLIVLKKEFSDDYPKGTIISQNVPANTELSQGTPIGVVISSGSKMCKVPDIIGKSVGEAHTLLENNGLLMGNQTEEYSDTYPAGTIIRLTGTSVGASMERDSFIMVVVSLGPEQ